MNKARNREPRGSVDDLDIYASLIRPVKSDYKMS